MNQTILLHCHGGGCQCRPRSCAQCVANRGRQCSRTIESHQTVLWTKAYHPPNTREWFHVQVRHQRACGCDDCYLSDPGLFRVSVFCSPDETRQHLDLWHSMVFTKPPVYFPHRQQVRFYEEHQVQITRFPEDIRILMKNHQDQCLVDLMICQLDCFKEFWNHLVQVCLES